MPDSKLQSLGSLGSKAKQITANVAKYFLQKSKKETSPASYIRRTVEATEVSRTTCGETPARTLTRSKSRLKRTITSSTNMKTPSLSTWQTIVAQSCDDYDSSTETASEGECNDVFIAVLFCFLCIIE